MRLVYIETYGCSANQAHSEMIEGSFVNNGFKVVKNIGKADMIVINTCIVKSPTENKIRERIKFLVSEYPDKKLIIAGCAADLGMFREIAPDALFLSSHKSKDIARLISKGMKETDKKIRKSPLVNITEIASGCLGSCAYCIVKLARGDLRS
ncbi:MAG: threonylcarbamoyladenosine tRNA methylthiotransferase, partial [Candidatus Aenigmarchaeota archaeon]